MDWADDRLSKRLTFSPEKSEAIFAVLADIDAVRTAFEITGKLPSQTISRLTQSVIITSTGASNRIEGNRLTTTRSRHSTAICGSGNSATATSRKSQAISRCSN